MSLNIVTEEPVDHYPDNACGYYVGDDSDGNRNYWIGREPGRVERREVVDAVVDSAVKAVVYGVGAVCAYYVKREIDDMFRRRREQRKLEAKASGEAVQRSLDEIAARLDALEGRRRGNVVPFRRAGA